MDAFDTVLVRHEQNEAKSVQAKAVAMDAVLRDASLEAPTLDGRSCRAARALLNWSSRRLATQSGVSVQAISDLERDRPVRERDRKGLEEAFREAGVLVLVEDKQPVGIRVVSRRAVQGVHAPEVTANDRTAIGKTSSSGVQR